MRKRLNTSTMMQGAGSGASWLGASVATACLLGLPTAASAGPFTPPAGVTQYRLAFVTDTVTTAESTDITDYNTFVTNDATNNSSLPATTWRAIASTSSGPISFGVISNAIGVDAASNITCGATCDSSVPIFLVDGTQVAISADAMFSGTIVHSIDKDESGNSLDFSYVWTGSYPDGTPAAESELGTRIPQFGITGSDESTMFTVGQFPSTVALPLYAISGEISAVPEPASFSLLAFGGAAMAFARRFRRLRPPSR
jgi:hypothetical protein